MELLDFTVSNDYSVTFDVSLPREEWAGYLEDISRRLQQEKPLKGFRPGSAPLSLAEKGYGKQLYQQAAKNAADACMEAVYLEKQVFPVSVPTVDIYQADATGFGCRVSLEQYPQVSSMAYQGLKAEKPVCKCTEAAIDAEIAQFLRQHLEVHQVDRPAQMGDIAQLDFQGTCDGATFPFDHSDNSRLILGSGILFTGLDEALCGHMAGETLELRLTMAADFHRREIAGLTLDLRVHIQSVWARDLPTLDDAFVRKFVKAADTVEQYREQVRQKLQDRLDARSEQLFQANLNAALAEKLPVEIPPAMIQTAAVRYRRTLAGLAKKAGKTVEEYLAAEGKTLEDYEQMLLPAAKEEAAVSIAIDYVIRAEKLQVSQERLDRYYQRYAASAKCSIAEARQRVDQAALVESYLQRDARKRILATAVPVEVAVEQLPSII